MQVSHRFLYFGLGFGLCSLTHFLGGREETYKATQISKVESKTHIKPAQVVYRDKFRTVEMKCPEIETQNLVWKKKIKSSTQKFSFKINALVEPTRPTDATLGVGVFLFDKMSLDIQTPMKFDKIAVGISLYF